MKELPRFQIIFENARIYIGGALQRVMLWNLRLSWWVTLNAFEVKQLRAKAFAVDIFLPEIVATGIQ